VRKVANFPSLDGYSNEDGGGLKVPLTEKDLIVYYRKLANEAHRLGMAIGIKNAVEILPEIASISQFAVNEECVQINTCSAYENFTNPARGGRGRGRRETAKPVFHVEYVNFTDKASNTTWRRPPPRRPTPVNITNVVFANLTSQQLRQTLCLERASWGKPAMASKLKLSTTIKTLSLNGWLLDCDGRTYVTKTKGEETDEGPELPEDTNTTDTTAADTALMASVQLSDELEVSTAATNGEAETSAEEDYIEIDVDEEAQEMEQDNLLLG